MLTDKQKERLRSFFYAKLGTEALTALDNLGLRKYWQWACEECALNLGHDIYRRPELHREFQLHRYEMFCQVLQQHGLIGPSEFLGVSVTTGIFTPPYGEDY